MQFFDQVFPVRQTGLLAVCVFVATVFSVAPGLGFSLQNKTDESDARSIGDYRADLKTFMKLSKDDDAQLERNAVFNLCQLHFEITIDSRFETSQQLQGIRAVIAKRLETFSKNEAKKRVREQRDAKRSRNRSSGSVAPTADDSNQSSLPDIDSDTGSVESDSDSENAFNDTTSGTTGSESDSLTADAMSHAASDSYYSMGALSGGPNQLFGYAGGRYAPPWDHGEDLVDLITSVINPTFWRRNGGVGSIHYYQPSRVLVIRATQQGNEEVGDLLEKLRANAGVQLNIGGVAGAIGN